MMYENAIISMINFWAETHSTPSRLTQNGDSKNYKYDYDKMTINNYNTRTNMFNNREAKLLDYSEL